MGVAAELYGVIGSGVGADGIALLTRGSDVSIILAFCGGGGIGRRVRLRGVWSNPWGFKSPSPHHIGALGFLQGSIFLQDARAELYYVTSHIERIFIASECGLRFFGWLYGEADSIVYNNHQLQ